MKKYWSSKDVGQSIKETLDKKNFTTALTGSYRVYAIIDGKVFVITIQEEDALIT